MSFPSFVKSRAISCHENSKKREPGSSYFTYVANDKHGATQFPYSQDKQKRYTLSNMAMENPQCMDDFPNKTSIYSGSVGIG